MLCECQFHKIATANVNESVVKMLKAKKKKMIENMFIHILILIKKNLSQS